MVFELSMKHYLLLAVIGLIFGLVTGCFEDLFAYLDSSPDPFSAHDHWYDILLLIPAPFSFPDLALDYWIYNPPDGNYGDEWDSRIPILVLNNVFWMLAVPSFSFLVRRSKFLWRKSTEADPSTSSG